MDKAGVQAAFVAAGLGRLVKDIDYLSLTAIRLSTTPVDEASLKPASSKIGGVPDLPPGMAWPEWKGEPQSFLAQLRCDELHRYDTEKVLPTQGMLWFFYNAQQDTYGEDPSDRGSWQVIFWDGDLSTLSKQQSAKSQFHSCAVSMSNEITLSQYPKLEILGYDWSDEELHKYENLLATFPSPDEHAAIHNRAMGHPDTIQDDMRIQCQLVSNGVKDASDPRAAELSRGAMAWRLLLQLDSDENANMRWGSSGMLYFWIKWSDLYARHFDRIWMVLQSD